MKNAQRTLAARRKNRHRQPRPAQGDLATVQAFLNTRGPKVDEALSSPRELAAWLAARGLLASDVKLKQRHLKRALAVRRGLHALVAANSGRILDGSAVEQLDEVAKRARIKVRFDGEGELRLAAGSDKFADALGRLLGIVAVARFEGGWLRLKVCADQECDAVFFDARLRGRWCSHRCGERLRARARSRRRG